ncbi:hypothetical protein C0992_009419 [Termitomyces sp. T32_za158]|nr:hypothetical protein C0992_009419 [Termitomyces sp. T32_za158]
MTWYVEDINGEVVSAQKVEQYRADARSVWQYLSDNGMAPNTWAEANLVAMNYYEHHMCTRHPELSYGSNNWKAHQIATDNYPSWAAGHLSRPPKVKHEARTRNVPKRSASSKLYSRPLKKSRLNPPAASNKTDVENHVHGPAKANIVLKIRNPLATVFSDPIAISTTSISQGSEKNSLPVQASTISESTSSISSTTAASISLTPPTIPAFSTILASTASCSDAMPEPLPNSTPSLTTSGHSNPSAVLEKTFSTAAPTTQTAPLAKPSPAPASVPSSLETNVTEVSSPPSTSITSVMPTHTANSTSCPDSALPSTCIPPAPQLPLVVPNIKPTRAPEKAPYQTANTIKQAVKKRSKKAKAGNANNAKSICKREWIEKNHGTEEEWTIYWDSLDTETLQVYSPM